jgi:hypothetical protein
MATKMSRKDPDGSLINWSPGSGLLIQDYGSADPEPREIFADPQYCLEQVRYPRYIQIPR